MEFELSFVGLQNLLIDSIMFLALSDVYFIFPLIHFWSLSESHTLYWWKRLKIKVSYK